jgi:hypothetical protein
MDMHKRGWTTVSLTVSKPSPDNPKGGTYNRLEKFLKYKRETWDEVIARLIDVAEKHMDEMK